MGNYWLTQTIIIVGHYVPPGRRPREAFKSEAGQLGRNSASCSIRISRQMAPSNTQRMENNGVSDCQLPRINDNLTGIAGNWIQHQTPALVPDAPLRMLPRPFRAVPIALTPTWSVRGPHFLWR